MLQRNKGEKKKKRKEGMKTSDERVNKLDFSKKANFTQKGDRQPIHKDRNKHKHSQLIAFRSNEINTH